MGTTTVVTISWEPNKCEYRTDIERDGIKDTLAECFARGALHALVNWDGQYILCLPDDGNDFRRLDVTAHFMAQGALYEDSRHPA